MLNNDIYTITTIPFVCKHQCSLKQLHVSRHIASWGFVEMAIAFNSLTQYTIRHSRLFYHVFSNRAIYCDLFINVKFLPFPFEVPYSSKVPLDISVFRWEVQPTPPRQLSSLADTEWRPTPSYQLSGAAWHVYCRGFFAQISSGIYRELCHSEKWIIFPFKAQ